jgi:hypothetical protein
MDQKQQDKLGFKLAKEYLEKTDSRVTPGLLEKYLRPEPRPKSLPDIYEHMLESAQNANMVSGVIKGGIGEISNLRPVLRGFDPALASESYTSPEGLLDAIVEELKPNGKIRRAPGSIWPKFCRTALQGAYFLGKFQSAESFYAWADDFDCDPRARPALPLIIASRVKGLGFALACDFIKELGFPNYAKPDVQLIGIFRGLGLSKDGDPYSVFCDIVRVANHAGRSVTPYAVDKVFWLIGSGNFYRDHFKIGSHKQQFVAYAGRELHQA